MAYLYDVFISYKRGGTKDVWLEKNFKPLFEEYLSDILLKKPEIFIDRTGLTQGADWSDGIIYALAHSKCLVAIVSPSYFMNSEWCIKEFLTIKFRQQKLNLQAGTIPPSLMWLIAIQDFENVPPIIHTIQLANYVKYNLIGDAFFRSDAFLDFQTDLRKDVKTVSNIIKNAPNWQEEWNTEQWKIEIKKIIEEYYQHNDDPKQGFLTW
jgi:TIR domain